MRNSTLVTPTPHGLHTSIKSAFTSHVGVFYNLTKTILFCHLIKQGPKLINKQGYGRTYQVVLKTTCYKPLKQIVKVLYPITRDPERITLALEIKIYH